MPSEKLVKSFLILHKLVQNLFSRNDSKMMKKLIKNFVERLSSGEPGIAVKVEKSEEAPNRAGDAKSTKTVDATNRASGSKKPGQRKKKTKKRIDDVFNKSIQLRASSRLASHLATQKISSTAKLSMGKTMKPKKVPGAKAKTNNY